jgi:hypothetical protein
MLDSRLLNLEASPLLKILSSLITRLGIDIRGQSLQFRLEVLLHPTGDSCHLMNLALILILCKHLWGLRISWELALILREIGGLLLIVLSRNTLCKCLLKWECLEKVHLISLYSNPRIKIGITIAIGVLPIIHLRVKAFSLISQHLLGRLNRSTLIHSLNLILSSHTIMVVDLEMYRCKNKD